MPDTTSITEQPPVEGQNKDATAPTDAGQKKAAAAKRHQLLYGTPPRPPFSKRAWIQLLTLVILIIMGVQFYNWVGHLEAGQIEGTRPPGVEGFLPIAALMSLRHLIQSGEFSMIHPAGLVIFSLVCLTGLFLKKAFC